MSLDMDLYQEQAHETSHNTRIGGDALLYPVLGLCGETGELANKVKKIHRDHDGLIGEDDLLALKQEIGDCIWYLAELCTQLGISLSDVADLNLFKLRSRKQRGVIGGSGDNR